MAYQFQNIKILIVDDSQPMREVMRFILLNLGATNIITADNAEKGYDIFCKENPDIVLADWEMAPSNGLDFVNKVRNDPLSPNPYAPIILVTGYSHKSRVMTARDTGVTEFLVKPFKARDLYKRIEYVIEHPRQYVSCADYFGPDRRRHTDSNYTGPHRRNGDSQRRTA